MNFSIFDVWTVTLVYAGYRKLRDDGIDIKWLGNGKTKWKNTGWVVLDHLSLKKHCFGTVEVELNPNAPDRR